MQNLKEIQLMVAMFEGRSISLEEAKQIQKETANRNKVLKTAFGLTDKEISLLCLNKDAVKELAKRLAFELDEKTRENVRRIEVRAAQKMRDPNRGRQMRALLAPR